MINKKIEGDLTGHNNWPAIATVEVDGNKEAKPFPDNVSEEQQEAVVQSWQKVAVLKVSPNVPFKIGYIHGESIHYLKVAVETKDGVFGMRVGDDKVTFFVIPVSLDAELNLDLVEVTNENDERHSELPLY